MTQLSDLTEGTRVRCSTWHERWGEGIVEEQHPTHVVVNFPTGGKEVYDAEQCRTLTVVPPEDLGEGEG